MTTIYNFLDSHAIPYQRFEHPPVFTCEEAERLCPSMPGSGTKNLFLRDKDAKRHFLIAVTKQKTVDLKKLKDVLGVSKIGFASPERLQKYLGLEPGSVTLLGVLNDPGGVVEVVIDAELEGQALQCHPLVNTATLVIEAEGLKRFFELTKHTPRFVAVPGRVM